MTGLSISLPMAAVLSLATAAVGTWAGMEKTQAAIVVRVDDDEKRVDRLEYQLKTFVPAGEFAIAVGDIKGELNEIRSDVKEIRRATYRK